MKNVTLQYNGSLKKVSSAVNKANEILGSEEFYKTIKSYRQFDNSSLNPRIIATLIARSGLQIDVRVNWIMPITKKGHNKIDLSGWDFSNRLGQGVNTLIYETVYCVDSLYNLLKEGHNERESGTRTAPFVIASIAEEIVQSITRHQTLIQV